jgi:hypothetical protein
MDKKSTITTSWYWDFLCVELDSNYKPTDDVVGVCIFLFQYFLVCPSYQGDDFIEDRVKEA